MKPKAKKPEIVFRIIDKKTGEAQGTYRKMWSYDFDFSTPEEARNANASGVFKNEERYKIARYRVTYELIEDDEDGEDA